MANFYHVICLQYVLRRVGRCRCRCKMQTDADDQSTARMLTNDPDEDRRRPLRPPPVKPKFKTSNSDAVHANCIFKLKIRGLDLDGSILILAMSVCQFPIWHRPLPRLVGGVPTEGQKGRMGRGRTAWPAQLPWVPIWFDWDWKKEESGRPPPLPPRATRRTCPAAAGEAQADRQRPHPAKLGCPCVRGDGMC